MAKFAFEVVVHGRINVVIEAESQEEAEDLLNSGNSPEIPEFDKLYDLEVSPIGEV